MFLFEFPASAADLASHLWRNRKRDHGSSRAAIRRWGRRIQMSPAWIRASWTLATLRSRGAQITATAHFSDSSSFEGRLENLSVGAESFVGRAKILLHDRVQIGDRACINDGVAVLTASHAIDLPDWRTITAPIVIGDHAWIATNAIILPGVKIGVGAVVGAGAVVTKDVPDGGVVGGNPAKLLSRTRVGNLNYSPIRFTALFSAWIDPQQPTQTTAPRKGKG